MDLTKKVLHMAVISARLGPRFIFECVKYMEKLTLDVQARDKSLKPKALLGQNLIPVEIYGKGIENQSFQVDYQSFRKLFKVSGTNTLVELNDGKKKYNVLVHDLQYNPISDRFQHVDFLVVNMAEDVTAKVPFEFTGTSVAVKDHSGTFVTHMDQLEIKCLPNDLIHTIEVDISPLVDFHTFIRVKDLTLPSNITVLTDAEEVIASVSAPAKEEVAAPVAEVAPVEGTPAA